MEQDHAYLDFTIKALVDNQDAVVITRSVDEMGVLLTLTVAPEDMGKIIGKDGNIAKAIRTLLRVVGMKHNARVNLKINEPMGGKRFGEENRSLEQPAPLEKPLPKSAASKAGGNPNFGLNMPLMCSAFDTSAWLNAA